MLSVQKRKAIDALCTQPSITKAAAVAGLSRNTIYTWLRDDAEFRTALAQAEAMLAEESNRRMIQMSAKADTVIAEVLDNGTPAARLRAALEVKKLTASLREFDVEAILIGVLQRYENTTRENQGTVTPD